MHVNRHRKVLHGSKQTLFRFRNEESAPGPREGDSGNKIHLVNMDADQHAMGFAVGNKLPLGLSCLVNKFEIHGRVTELGNLRALTEVPRAYWGPFW